jgi:recombinational DNA repair ATPase RecF
MLVDELASELDKENRSRFSGVLRDLGLQTFVTAVSDSLVSADGWNRVAHFVAEQGKVRQVLQ